MLLALLWLLTESVVKVPASHWTAIELKIEQNGATVHADFEVRNGAKIQAMVLSRKEAERLNRGRSVHPLFSSGFTTGDQFRVLVPDAGDYVLLLGQPTGTLPGRGGTAFRAYSDQRFASALRPGDSAACHGRSQPVVLRRGGRLLGRQVLADLKKSRAASTV